MPLLTMADGDWSVRGHLIKTGLVSSFTEIWDLGPKEGASPPSYW